MTKVPKHYTVFPTEHRAQAVLQRALQKFLINHRKRKNAAVVIQRAWSFLFRMKSVQRVVLRYNECNITLFTAERTVSYGCLKDQVQSDKFYRRFNQCVLRIYNIFYLLKTIPKEHFQTSFLPKILMQAFLIAGQPKSFFSSCSLYRAKDAFVEAAKKFVESLDFICKRIGEGPKTLDLKTLLLESCPYAKCKEARNFGSFLFLFQNAYLAWKDEFLQFNVNQMKSIIREHYILLQKLSPFEKMYKSDQYELYQETIKLNKVQLVLLVGEYKANAMELEIQSDVSSRLSSPLLFYYTEKQDYCSMEELVHQILLDSSFQSRWNATEDWFTKSIFHVLLDDLTVFKFPNCNRVITYMNLIFEKMCMNSTPGLFVQQAKEIWNSESIEESVKNQNDVEVVLTFFVNLLRQTLDIIRGCELFQGKEYVISALSALDMEYGAQPSRNNHSSILFICLCVQKIYAIVKHFQYEKTNKSLIEYVERIVGAGKRIILEKFDSQVLRGDIQTDNLKTEVYRIVDFITQENPCCYQSMFAAADFSKYCNSLMVINLIMTGPSKLCKVKLPETLQGFYHNLHYAHEKLDFFVKVFSMLLRLQSSYFFYRALKNNQSFEVCLKPLVDFCNIALDFSNKNNIVMTQSAYAEGFLAAVKMGFQIEPNDLEFVQFHLYKTLADDDCVAKLQKTRMSKLLTEYVLMNATEMPNLGHVAIFKENLQVLFNMVKKMIGLHMDIFGTRIHAMVLERVGVYQK